jgi:methionyl-tRNA formyltransferase
VHAHEAKMNAQRKARERVDWRKSMGRFANKIEGMDWIALEFSAEDVS